MSFADEIRKIPPVTRFLCGASLAVTLPALAQLVPPYSLIFVKELVTQRLEIWRPFTSFFLGSSGLGYLFEIVMLYRNSLELETAHFARRSADYAWQLFLASLGILGLNIPLRSFTHTRALLLALTYVSSRLAPPGAQTSLFGLLTFPLAYLPFVLIALDFVMGGPRAAAQAVSGAVVGHLWWWGVWESGALREAARAPAWVRRIVGDGPGPLGGTGVHVVPPRAREEVRATTGHRWGSGRRLGEN
ncbi:DER1-domain-containing protein [Obba rivulosa]|uniref:Derlin n=1 Tax=Obba rivulosa TaxID=1052685 RepID=A0A8E2AUN8_9APHY|nr:DER1-domain-containing protein [Obba rivulosa]